MASLLLCSMHAGCNFKGCGSVETVLWGLSLSASGLCVSYEAGVARQKKGFGVLCKALPLSYIRVYFPSVRVM
jgi:hypothetical protein